MGYHDKKLARYCMRVCRSSVLTLRFMMLVTRVWSLWAWYPAQAAGLGPCWVDESVNSAPICDNWECAAPGCHIYLLSYPPRGACIFWDMSVINSSEVEMLHLSETFKWSFETLWMVLDARKAPLWGDPLLYKLVPNAEQLRHNYLSIQRTIN